MLKKFVALLVIAMLIVPATALANGKHNIAASTSQSQSIAVQNASDDGDATDIEKQDVQDVQEVQDEQEVQKDNGRDDENNASADHGKGKSVGAAESSNEDLSDDEDQAEMKKEKLAKEDKEALKEAEKKAEKESVKAQKDNEDANGDDGDIDSDEDSSAVESDDTSGTAGAAVHGKKFWAKNASETADGETSDEDSPTATARGKGIANAMSKIVRNIERMGEHASDVLKSVVNKFASWLGLVLPFPDVSISGNAQSGTQASDDSSATAGGIETTSTAAALPNARKRRTAA